MAPLKKNQTLEGTYTSSEGANSENDCIACEAGYFCSGEIVSNEQQVTLYNGMSGRVKNSF